MKRTGADMKIARYVVEKILCVIALLFITLASAIAAGPLVAIDPYDGSMWTTSVPSSSGSAGSSSSRVHAVAHLDRDGKILRSITLEEPAMAIGLALDQSVWIASAGELMHV